MRKIFTILLLTNLAHSYVPSVESLFRNNGNSEISSNTVVLNMKIEKLKIDSEEAEKKSLANSSLNTFDKGFFKLLYVNEENKNNVKLLQLSYKDQEMKPTDINGMKYVDHFNKFPFAKGVESTEQGLFYSLMSTLVLNDGFMMINFLRSRGVSVRYNEEIINKDKVDVLLKYKDYLNAVNRDKDLKTTVTSPLTPENEDQRLKVRGLLKAPFFKETVSVKRVKEKNTFYWKVETDNFSAKFDNESRNLVEMELNTTWGSIAISCKDYILFDGVHEFPKYIYYKDLQGQYFKIEMVSMKQFTQTENSFQKNFSKYQDNLSENKSDEIKVLKPSFLL